MHAFASPFPIGAGFTRFTDTVFCDASVYLLMRFFGGQLVSDGEFIVLLCRFNATALLYILYRQNSVIILYSHTHSTSTDDSISFTTDPESSALCQ